MRHYLYLLAVALLLVLSSCYKQTPAEAAAEANASIQALFDSIDTRRSALELYQTRCSIERKADSIVRSKEALFHGNEKKLSQLKGSLINLKANRSYRELIEITYRINKKALNAIPTNIWLINTATNDVRSICKFKNKTVYLYNFDGNINLTTYDDAYKSSKDISDTKIFFESGEEYTISTWAGDSLISATFRPATDMELYYGLYRGDGYFKLMADNRAIIDYEEATYEIVDDVYNGFCGRFNARRLTLQNGEKQSIMYELWPENGKQPRNKCHDVMSVMNCMGIVKSFYREIESEPRNILCLFDVDETYWN